MATGETDTTLAAVGDVIRSFDDEIAGVAIAACAAACSRHPG
ncbi:hypothetical protein [Microbacterium sp. RG1]|nr:hypothetical protein [Microbacterium sp. RG1]